MQDSTDIAWFFNCQITPITLSMTLGFYAVKKNIRYVELQGANLITSQMLVMASTNYLCMFEMDQFRN